ncbi:tRNA (adenosine(37)-N6)-threonylcarbamoyltransferase complex ATPase subunit type 1 TsaE [Halocynthiibacter sp.]|uniref:tRNA (adenosine(37)-N6)-threonylcarbamoyltransferase complex ATPase subunit type 1 TsaE n=1 Tax=Halocynthiibacter sp. TaxID=1979210 RepID=UPI003C46DCC2
MQDLITFQCQFIDENQTADFARTLAAQLQSGDCILLEGPVGAGKSFFARAAIQSLLAEPEDIPSPTFTLVQTYEGPVGEIWHSDLYRLSHPDEVEELGLVDAMNDAVCFIEWPDRLGSYMPQGALMLRFETGSDIGTRNLHVSSTSERWKFLQDGMYANEAI